MQVFQFLGIQPNHTYISYISYIVSVTLDHLKYLHFIFYNKNFSLRRWARVSKGNFKIIEQCETSLKWGTFNTIFNIVIMTEIFEACNTLEVFFLTKLAIPTYCSSIPEYSENQ